MNVIMTGKFEGIPLKQKIIMGIINLSPETFYKESIAKNPKKTAAKAVEMVENGADIIDIGGMATGPDAKLISMDKERELLKPSVKAVRKKVDAPISIDTQRAGIAKEMLDEGADIINDISGFKADPQIAQLVSEYECSAIIMANGISGRIRRAEKKSGDIRTIKDVKKALKESLDICRENGVKLEKVAIDPGIGFGREKEEDLKIISKLKQLRELNRPICVGLSRKSFIGKVLDLDNPSERLIGSLGATAIALKNEAGIIRTHDPKETSQFIHMMSAIKKARD
ncbi:MAG: dihydropteroate synthase [Candidatus Hadarchaeota archaeon]